MIGPIQINCRETVYSAFYRVEDHDSSIIDPLLYPNSKCFKYTSDDLSLICVLVSTRHTSSEVKVYTDDKGIVRQVPNYEYIIFPLEGKKRLLEIIKEKNIADDFETLAKIKYNTEAEAEEVLKKILN